MRALRASPVGVGMFLDGVLEVLELTARLFLARGVVGVLMRGGFDVGVPSTNETG